MKSKTKIIKNSSWNWIHFIVTAIIAFFVSPYYINKLGNTYYGLWTIVTSLTGYYGLLDLGVRNALVRYISKYRGRNDNESINEVINTCFFFFVIVAVVIAVTTVLLAFNLESFFSIQSRYVNDAKLTMLILGIGLAIQFPLNAFSGVIVGFQRFDITSKIWLVVAILRSLLCVFLLSHGYDLLAMAIVTVGADLVAYVTMAFRGLRLFPHFSLSFRLPPRERVKEIFSFSLYSFLIGVAGKINSYASPIIIGAVVSVSAVTIYSIPMMLLMYVSVIINNFSRVLQPFASTVHERGDFDEIKDIAIWSTKVSALLYVPLAIILLTIGSDFIALWIGEQFKESTSNVLSILCVSFLFVLVPKPMENILVGVGHVKFVAFVLLGEVFLCLLGAIILGRYFSLEGVAIGMGVPIVFSRGIFIPIYGMKKLGISLFTLFFESLFYPLILGGVVYLLASVVHGSLPAFSYFYIVLHSICVVGTYWFLYVVFDSALRVKVMTLCTEKLRGIFAGDIH